MHDVLRFWLDRGVDGFRIDVAHLIGKDPALPDQPAAIGQLDRVGIHNDPRTHLLLRGIRRVVDSYPGERVIVGEVNLHETSAIRAYYGQRDELHMAFNFLPLSVEWTAAAWRDLIETVERELGPGAWPTWVLSNHDTRRHRTRLGGDERRARAAAVLLLTLRGTPFMYQGEELGLEDADVPEERRVDPGGRDGCRAPIPWTQNGATAGRWRIRGYRGRPRPAPAASRPSGTTLAPCFTSIARCSSSGDPRRRSARGRSGWDPSPGGILAYERRAGDDLRQVLVSFADRELDVPLEHGWTASVRSAGEAPWDGRLQPNEAVVLRPR